VPAVAQQAPQAPATQNQSTSDQTSTPDQVAPGNIQQNETATVPSHHRRHHHSQQQASSSGERAQTRNLNMEQLAKVRSEESNNAMSQNMAPQGSPPGQTNQASPNNPQNGSYGGMNSNMNNNDMNAGSTCKPGAQTADCSAPNLDNPTTPNSTNSPSPNGAGVTTPAPQ
jgi:hypothetical protein